MSPNNESQKLRLKVIQTLCRTLQQDSLPLARVIAADTLGVMQAKTQEAIDTLCKVIVEDPEAIVRIATALALRKIYGDPQTSTELQEVLNLMSEQPKVQMTFNAPVTGVAGNVEGDFNNLNVPTPELTEALDNLKQLIEEFQQKSSTSIEATDATQIAEIVEAELVEIQRTDPSQWRQIWGWLDIIFTGGVEAVKIIFPVAGIPIEVGRKIYDIYRKDKS